jgi:hypothetical protein
MNFSDIPIRGYAKTDPSWWNSLRAAGMSIQAFLGVFIVETFFTITNYQSTPANVTGLSFDGSVIRSFNADYQIYRQPQELVRLSYLNQERLWVLIPRSQEHGK